MYNIFPSLFDLALSVLGSVKPWCFPVCCPNRCPYFELHISHVCVVGVNKCEKIALAFCARFYLFLYLFLYFLSISFFFFFFSFMHIPTGFLLRECIAHITPHRRFRFNSQQRHVSARPRGHNWLRTQRLLSFAVVMQHANWLGNQKLWCAWCTAATCLGAQPHCMTSKRHHAAS